jgi:hypothetical protein
MVLSRLAMMDQPLLSMSLVFLFLALVKYRPARIEHTQPADVAIAAPADALDQCGKVPLMRRRRKGRRYLVKWC